MNFSGKYLEQPLAQLLAGNALAQLMIFGSIPVITRLYPTEAVGQWSIALTVINVISAFSQLRTDIALFQASTDTERNALYRLGITAHIVLSCVTFTVITLLGWVHWASIEAGIVTLFILLAHGILQMSISRMAAQHQFRQQNLYRLAIAFLAYPGAVIGYYIGGSHWLLGALLMGNMVPLGYLISTQQMSQIWPKNIFTTLKAHKNTGFYLTVGNLLASISDQGMVLLIARFYSSSEAAACFLAMRVCSAPLSLIQGALTPYNYRHFQDLYDTAQFSKNTIIAHWKKWLPIALLIFIPLIPLGMQIFSLFLGKDWNFAGQIASVIAIWSLTKFLTTPTSMGFFITGNTRFFFWSTVLTATTLPLCVYLAQNGWSLLHLMLFFALTQTILLLCSNIFMLYLIDQKFHAQRHHN